MMLIVASLLVLNTLGERTHFALTNVEAVRTNISKINNYATLKGYQPSYLFVICNLSSSRQAFPTRFKRLGSVNDWLYTLEKLKLVSDLEVC